MLNWSHKTRPGVLEPMVHSTFIQDEDKLNDEQELYVQVDLMSLVNQNLNIPCTYYRFDSFTETDYV